MRVSVLVAALLLAILGLTLAPAAESASAAQAIEQCNGVANGGGQGLECDITVTNNRNVSTGVESSTVVLEACSGPANTALTCALPVTTQYNSLTTEVKQCNDAANGGGSSLICSVSVVNNVTGATAAAVSAFTAATVNQCDGSGAAGTAPTLNCDPAPATTTDATITQCNKSVNGGGAPERVTCTVTPSTTSVQVPVKITQCNDTANGGGSIVTCTASLTNFALVSAEAAATPTPAPTAGATAVLSDAEAESVRKAGATAPIAKNTLHDAQTDGFVATTGADPVIFVGIGALLLAALLVAGSASRRTRAQL